MARSHTRVKPPLTKAKKVVYKWDNRYYYRCHRLALEGMNDTQIASVLQVSVAVFRVWKKKRPSLRAALDEGREEFKGMKNNLSGYIFDRLSPEARDVWDRLKTAWESDDTSSRERRLRSVLDGSDETTTKSLFLHAVAYSRFNPSEAMKMVGVSPKQVRAWAVGDRTFLEALDEIEVHKKNWFEGKLTGLVDSGHDGAILFVNRTYNADRGYSPKQSVNVTSTINHVHSGQVTLDSVSQYLDVATLEKLHAAVQAVRAAALKVEQIETKALPALLQDTAVVDGEIVGEGAEAD